MLCLNEMFWFVGQIEKDDSFAVGVAKALSDRPDFALQVKSQEKAVVFVGELL